MVEILILIDLTRKFVSFMVVFLLIDVPNYIIIFVIIMLFSFRNSE